MSDVEQEIRAQEAVLATAMKERDVNTLSRLIASEYAFTSANGETWGREHAIADLANPRLRISRITVEVDKVVTAGEVGIATGRSEVEGGIGEYSLSGRFRFTHVWRHEAGHWQIVAAHTSSATKAD